MFGYFKLCCVVIFLSTSLIDANHLMSPSLGILHTKTTLTEILASLAQLKSEFRKNPHGILLPVVVSKGEFACFYVVPVLPEFCLLFNPSLVHPILIGVIYYKHMEIFTEALLTQLHNTQDIPVESYASHKIHLVKDLDKLMRSPGNKPPFTHSAISFHFI